MPKTIKQLFNFLISSNIHIALCSCALYIFCAEKSFQKLQFEKMTFCFCSTLLVYHLLRFVPNLKHQNLTGIFKDYYHRHSLFHFYFFTPFYFLGTLYGLSFFGPREFSLLIIGIGLIWNYEKLSPYTFHLRRLPLIKPLSISASWTILMAILVENISIINCIDISIFIFLLCLPFDLKDYHTDQRQNIHTIPRHLHEYMSKILFYAFLIYSVLFYFMQRELFFFIACPLYFLGLKNINRNEIFVYLIFDGLIVMRCLFYLAQN